MIEAGFVEVRGYQLDVDEMPLSRSLPRVVDVGIAELVSPRRGIGDVVRCQWVRIRREQSCHSSSNVGVKK